MSFYHSIEWGTVVEIPDELAALLGDGWAAGLPAPTGGDKSADTAAGPPPKSGKGSTDAAWTAYARAHKVDVTDEMKRSEVIEACEKAGVPTE